VRATAEGRDPNATRVRGVLTPGVLSGFEDQDVGEAAQRTQERPVRRPAVLNRDKPLVGIVSLADRAVESGDERLAGRTPERVSEPA
jgi:CBS domain-containing protein